MTDKTTPDRQVVNAWRAILTGMQRMGMESEAIELVDDYFDGVERRHFERSAMTNTTPPAIADVELRNGFAPCPLCKQYSHSIGEGQLTDAYNHFQSMYSHRGDGIPTQFSFDEKTRDAARVLMAAALTESG